MCSSLMGKNILVIHRCKTKERINTHRYIHICITPYWFTLAKLFFRIGMNIICFATNCKGASKGEQVFLMLHLITGIFFAPLKTIITR